MSTSSTPSGLRYAARAFAHRNYLLFWCGALGSNVGSWLANLAVPYVLFQLTGSALWVGAASVAQLLPGVLLGPWGGSLADRCDRRRVLLVTQTGMAVSASCLWLIWATGVATPWMFMVVLGMVSLFQGVNLPVWQSFVNDLVPREDLSSAVALNSLQFNGARALGPALAGILIATLGPGWAFFLNGMSFVGVLLALAAVRLPSAPAPPTPRPQVLRDFVAAVRYVGGQPGIQIAILLSVIVGVLGNPIFTLTVVFADDVFQVGALGLGLMGAALGAGSLLVAPLISGGIPGLTLGRITRLALPWYGVMLIGFALSGRYAVGCLLLVGVGMGFMALIASANTAIQLIVAGPVRGRVISVRIVVFSTSMPLGSALQGWVADQVGAPATVAGAGVLVLVAAVLLSGLDRGRWLARLDDPHDEAVPPGGTTLAPTSSGHG
ncbi:MFS transporter [Nocardioides sp.]|uniref:MFS transporter n=1 Tax=Nocardioides sp. TaxID=35761 RepID=UPI002624AD99|nr:MFS transporter [Nocardioides sp.]